MYNVHYLNKISTQGTALFTEDYKPVDNLEEAEAILVRSANMHEMKMPENLLAVARAGAGVNNIPLNDGDWKELHDQATSDIVVAHSWFRSLSGLDYSSGFSGNGRRCHDHKRYIRP